MKKAVIAVDIQQDFTEAYKGSLAVPGSHEEFLKKCQMSVHFYKNEGLPVIASQDWHPRDHLSFASQHPGKKPLEMTELDGRPQVLWPDHCIQDSQGAKLLIHGMDDIVQKGMRKRFDSYSSFFDDGKQSTDLHAILQKKKIEQLIVFGIATDYCVKATVLDALELGYRVEVLGELCRGVSEDSSREAIVEMQDKSAIFI